MSDMLTVHEVIRETIDRRRTRQAHRWPEQDVQEVLAKFPDEPWPDISKRIIAELEAIEARLPRSS